MKSIKASYGSSGVCPIRTEQFQGWNKGSLRARGILHVTEDRGERKEEMKE